ncbi:MAG: radical SAM protein [Candidatus Helarchaeota archaeon]
MTLSENSILKALTPDNVKRAIPLGFGLLKRAAKKRPLAVNYDLTYSCNLRCEHCYFSRAVEEKRLQNQSLDELTDEQWIKTFRYHHSLGINSAALTGGEPTLRMNLIKEAVDIFPMVQIATNGLIKMPKFPGKQPVIWTSLDGRPETHNAIRGAEVFDRVIENIQNDKRIFISMAVSASNYDEIDVVAKIAHDANVRGLFFLFYTGYPGDPLLLKGKSLRKAVKGISKAMMEYGDFIVISKKMIETYVTKSHVPTCIFKNGGVQSFYPNGKRKYCVMGNSPALCANCGCIVPVASHCLAKFDPETIEKLKKFPF